MFEPGAYDVEESVFSGKFRTLYVRSDGMTVSDQRALADRLTVHFDTEPITVVRRGGRPTSASHASYEKRTITMGALAGPAIVCHEVAHILTGTSGSSTTEDGYHHGPTWQAHYVACVRAAISEFHADRLARAFAKFEADKTSRKAKAAVKRGARRSATKSGPRRRTVEVTDKPRSKALGKAAITWNGPESYLAIRYSTSRGWYWRVCGYLHADLPKSAAFSVWESLARGEISNKPPLFVEGQFSTKNEALAWAQHTRVRS